MKRSQFIIINRTTAIFNTISFIVRLCVLPNTAIVETMLLFGVAFVFWVFAEYLNKNWVGS